jgi:hypothetical protein
MDWVIENAPAVFAAAFILALAVIGGLYSYQHSLGGRERRLGVVDRASVDGRRKLLLVRRDNVEHLILIGGPIDVILETGIERRAQPQTIAAARSAYENGLESNAEPHTPAPPVEPREFPAARSFPELRSLSAAQPFQKARKLFSKLSSPVVASNEPARDPEPLEAKLVELGDERQAEKLN